MNSKLVLGALLISFSLAGSLTYWLIIKTNTRQTVDEVISRQVQPVDPSTVTPFQQPVKAEKFIDDTISVQSNLRRRGSDNVIAISLESVSGSGDLSTFAIQADLHIPNTRFTQPGEFIPNPDILQLGWTFPVKKITANPDGGLQIRIAGAFLSPEKFQLSQGLEIGTIELTVGNLDNFQLTLDQTQTKFFNKQAERYRLTTDI